MTYRNVIGLISALVLITVSAAPVEGDQSESDTISETVYETAIAAWPSEEQLARQLAYQLEFRSRVDYMSTDPEHLETLLLDRPDNIGWRELGLHLTESEAIELKRRLQVGDRMSAVVEYLTGATVEAASEGDALSYGPNFGGIWQDQLDGGRIIVALVDPTGIDLEVIKDLVGGPENLRVIQQDFSFDQIEAFKAQLAAEMRRLGTPFDVVATLTPTGRLLEVRVREPSALPSIGKGLPEGSFTVVKGDPVVEASAPNTTHAFADQQAGLRVGVRVGGYGTTTCTWGFNGHTNSYHYLVMSGHCFNSGGYDNHSGSWLGNVGIYQNNSSSRDLTPGNAYLFSVDNGTYDFARISSSYARDNCYHGSHLDPPSVSHCQFKMQERALHNSWELGSDLTCASLGNSGVYKCGFVVEENANGARTVRVDMSSVIGDSGSGFKYANRIDGILRSKSSTQTFFLTAYDAQVALGSGFFYFNCAVGKKVTNDPGTWGSCPAIDA